MVIVSEVQLAVIPKGKPAAGPMPVAPVVLCVMFVNNVPSHKVGVEEAGLKVFTEITVIVPVALMLPHPPVKGIL
jgi:hypothetical protein